MDLNKIGDIMGAVNMVSGKPQKSKNSGGGMIFVGIVLIIMGAIIAFVPNDAVNIKGDKWVLFVPLLLGIVFVVSGVVSIILNKKKQQAISVAKSSGIKYQGYIAGVQRTGSRISNEYGVMVEQNNVIIEVQTPQGIKHAKVRLAGVGDQSFVKYRQNPTPITVYGDPSNPDNLIVDEDEVLAVTNSIAEAVGEIINHNKENNI